MLLPPLHEVNEVKQTLLRSSGMSSYCVQLTKMLTSEGDIFVQELTFHFCEVSFPIF